MKSRGDIMENSYKTKDLYLGAYLYALDQKFLGIEGSYGKLFILFEDRISCEKLSKSYWRKEALINAKEFTDALRTLKDLIFNK